MAKIRTVSQLQEALDEEMSWRIREISVFRLGSKKSDGNARIMARAGVALLYAHWEGFIKTASQCYINFLNNQGLKYKDVKTCFAALGVRGHISTLKESRKTAANILALEAVIDTLEDTVKIALSNSINTESNLTSTVFENIAISVNVDTTRYQTKFNLIDQSLVERRNNIAHGEYIDLDADSFGDLVDDVLSLMRWYKTDLENAASQATYKK